MKLIVINTIVAFAVFALGLWYGWTLCGALR